MLNGLGYLGFSPAPDEVTNEAPIFFVPWQTLTAPETIKMLTKRNGYNPDLSIARKTGQYTDYNFKTFLSPDAGAAMLAFWLGGTDTVTPGTPNIHNYAISDSQPPFLSVESSMGNGAIVQRVPGCRVGKVSISAVADQLVEIDAVIHGRQVLRQSSGATVVFETEDQWLSFLDGALTFTGLTVDSFDVMEMKTDLTNTITPRQPIGNFAPRYLREARELALSYKVLAPDDQLFREINWGSSSGTGPVQATTYLGSLVQTYSLGAGLNQVVLTHENIEMEQAHSSWNVNAAAWEVDCMGKQIRADLPMLAVEADNSNATPYVS